MTIFYNMMSGEIEMLHERIHLMEMINDASIDGVMVFDTNLSMTYWNESCEIITGISRDGAIRRNFFEIFPTFKDNKDVNGAINHALKGRKAFVPHEKAAYPGGYYEHHFVPLKAEGNRVDHVLNIVHDVAHRIKVEQELKSLNRSLVRKNKELKNSIEELSLFSKVASQQLKEPLHLLYTSMELLQQNESSCLTENDREDIKRLQALTQRMRLLVDDITVFANLGEGKHEFSAVDLGHILTLACEELREKICEHSVSIESDKLPTVKGDERLLLQLFRNLILNAMSMRAPGRQPSITVHSATISGEELLHPDAVSNMKYARISFADNGTGFDEKTSEQLFQMFPATNTKVHTSAAVGLPACKKIAELHGGFITADSPGETGSVFNLFLPLAKTKLTKIGAQS